MPTTLIGLIDASVSIKVAVNHGKSKNRLGAYHASQKVILDFSFLKTLPIDQVRNGFAELIKISVVANSSIFDLLEKHGEDLVNTRFGHLDGTPEIREIAHTVTYEAISTMLDLEVPNLHERNLDRVIAYGHTWSPTLELTPDIPYFHGHAINIDMAFSVTIAEQRGYISISDRDRIFWLMCGVGLAIDSPFLTPDLLGKATKLIVQTRGGLLRAAVPHPVGNCGFVNDLTIDELERMLAIHKEVCRSYPRNGDGEDMFIFSPPAPSLMPRPVTPVSILAATLRDVVRRLDTLDGLDPAVLGDLKFADELAGGLDDYLSACTTPESPALRQLAERTQAEDWAARSDRDGTARLEQEMLSGHVEGQTLKLLVSATRARRVLEIGMFTGYSALAMAEALPPDGQLIACEVDAYVADFARQCFAASPSGQKIVIEVGPALDTLGELASAGDSFDLVFIDADKPSYEAYLGLLLDAELVAPHGLICVDNTLMQGHPYLSGPSTVNGEAIEAFNRMVAHDPRVEQVLIPLRDGLTLIRPVDAS